MYPFRDDDHMPRGRGIATWAAIITTVLASLVAALGTAAFWIVGR
jgi:hypothetical protein